MDTSNFTLILFNYLRGGIFIVVVLIVLISALVGGLYIRRHRKLRYPVLEVIGLGNGKIGVLKNRAGWFKSRSALWGLYDYKGEELLRTKDNRIILNASTSDFHEIGGKRGLILKRKDDDPKVLAPIGEVNISNYNLLAEIAPASYRDASVRLIKQAEAETAGFIDKYGQFLLFAGTIFAFVIAMVLIVQMVKNGQENASNLILQAGELVKNSIASNAP